MAAPRDVVLKLPDKILQTVTSAIAGGVELRLRGPICVGFTPANELQPDELNLIVQYFHSMRTNHQADIKFILYVNHENIAYLDTWQANIDIFCKAHPQSALSQMLQQNSIATADQYRAMLAGHWNEALLARIQAIKSNTLFTDLEYRKIHEKEWLEAQLNYRAYRHNTEVKSSIVAKRIVKSTNQQRLDDEYRKAAQIFLKKKRGNESVLPNASAESANEDNIQQLPDAAQTQKRNEMRLAKQRQDTLYKENLSAFFAAYPTDPRVASITYLENEVVDAVFELMGKNTQAAASSMDVPPRNRLTIIMHNHDTLPVIKDAQEHAEEFGSDPNSLKLAMLGFNGARSTAKAAMAAAATVPVKPTTDAVPVSTTQFLLLVFASTAVALQANRVDAHEIGAIMSEMTTQTWSKLKLNNNDSDSSLASASTAGIWQNTRQTPKNPIPARLPTPTP